MAVTPAGTFDGEGGGPTHRSYERARQILAAAIAAHPERPEPVIVTARIDTADGRLDLARQAIEAARGRSPQHEAGWQQALSEIMRLEAEQTTD